MGSLDADTNCPNCQAVTLGDYCHRCGQHYRRFDQFFLSLISEALEDVLRADSRTLKTVGALLLRPGFLTTEILANRRARYLPPIRLFLVTSVIMFFLATIGMATSQAPIAGAGIGKNEATQNEGTTESAGAAPAVVPDQNPADIRFSLDERDEMVRQLDRLDIPGLSEQENQSLRLLLKGQLMKMVRVLEAEPTIFINQYIDVLAVAMFFLVPLFAVILKIAYIGSRRYYSEHLLFAINNHSFIFTAMIALRLMEFAGGTWFEWVTGPVSAAVRLWVLVYLYLGLLRFYGQGHAVTMIKYCLLAACYFVVLLLGVLATFVWQVMML